MKSLLAILTLAGIAALSAGAFAGFRLATLLTDLSQATIDASTAILEARATIEAVRTDTHQTLSRALDQVVGARVDLMRELHSIRSTEVPFILGQATSKLDRALLLAELSGERIDGQIDRLNRNVAAVLDPAAATLRRVDESSAILLDCKGNGACLPAQTLALVGSARYTMGQVARAAPEASRAFLGIEASIHGTARVVELGFPKIVTNIGGITDNVNKLTKPSPWDQFLKWSVSGAAAYGALR